MPFQIRGEGVDMGHKKPDIFFFVEKRSCEECLYLAKCFGCGVLGQRAKQPAMHELLRLAQLAYDLAPPVVSCHHHCWIEVAEEANPE